MTTTTTEREQQRDNAIAYLREIFPVGSTAHTILRHISSSGMTRWISVIGPDNNDVSWAVARAMGDKLAARYGGIKVGGCGMDMGFHLVYSMSRTLYPEGHACTGVDYRNSGQTGDHVCPSNDHSNGDREYQVGKTHSDGGYAVSQRWL